MRPSADGKSSSLFVCTADRPGLLVEIVKELKDMSINVLSAEIDTIGDIAKVASPHQLVRYDWSTVITVLIGVLDALTGRVHLDCPT